VLQTSVLRRAGSAIRGPEEDKQQGGMGIPIHLPNAIEKSGTLERKETTDSTRKELMPFHTSCRSWAVSQAFKSLIFQML